MPFKRPTPSWPIGCPGVDHPQGILDVFSYYELVMLFSNMVCLTVALASQSLLRKSSKFCLLSEIRRLSYRTFGSWEKGAR
jgi:hypothetical protein